MPCGQKKRRSEMIQSQMVTPPLAAMEGTTFRLKTATTNRRTRSRRPRARIRWGGGAGWGGVGWWGKKGRALGVETPFFCLGFGPRLKAAPLKNGKGGGGPPPLHVQI